MAEHNHITRDIKPHGICEGCDKYHLHALEIAGKELLKHKYLYYIVAEPAISDHEYDRLEVVYTQMAKEITVEPEVHLIADWNELHGPDGEWITNGAVVGFPHDHPWAAEIIKEEER